MGVLRKVTRFILQVFIFVILIHVFLLYFFDIEILHYFEPYSVFLSWLFFFSLLISLILELIQPSISFKIGSQSVGNFRDLMILFIILIIIMYFVIG